MIQLLLTAPASGSGKTMMACALLRALQRRGFFPCALNAGRTTGGVLIRVIGVLIDFMFTVSAPGGSGWIVAGRVAAAGHDAGYQQDTQQHRGEFLKLFHDYVSLPYTFPLHFG